MRFLEKNNINDMKCNIWRIFCFVLLITISSCNSHKRVVYLQPDGEREREYQLISYYKENTVRFQPDDVLSITVNLPGGEASVVSDFNLPFMPTATGETSSENYVNFGVGMQTYIVDKEGNIDFPVIGQLRIAGYTRAELEQYIKTLIFEKYLKEKAPIVTVRLLNFRIMVQGEVNRPGPISVSRDHINLLEALTLAGDMTILGKRDDIRIVREMPDGTVKIIRVDISKESLMSSPDFYLHQNDMIMVTPNRTRTEAADMLSPRFSTALSLIFSLISLYSFITYLSR
jgi:polysaccharide export outer membrane protein